MAENPYVNKVEYGGETLIDLTGDTVTPETMLAGATAHDKSGAPITGSVVVTEGLSVIADNTNPYLGQETPQTIISITENGTSEEIIGMLMEDYPGTARSHIVVSCLGESGEFGNNFGQIPVSVEANIPGVAGVKLYGVVGTNLVTYHIQAPSGDYSNPVWSKTVTPMATKSYVDSAITNLQAQIDALAGIPSEYQELEYILSTSKNAYIDTGLTMDGTLGFVIEGCTGSSDAGILFDCYVDANNRMGGIIYNRATPRYDRYWTGVEYAQQATTGIDLGQKFTLVQDQNGVTIKQGSVVQTGAYAGTTQTGTTPILLCSSQRSSYATTNSTIYSAKIYKQYELLRDFVPCVRKVDSVVGLYDKVTKMLYTSAGSEAFTGGTPV